MDENESMAQDAGLTRRTVVQGVAWSLPVIAAAVATPVERVYLSSDSESGTYNSAWIRGQGAGANPWRPFTGSPNAEVIPTSDAGNVQVSAPSLSSFSLTFVANNSGRAVNDRPVQNIWVGPLTFTAVNPACQP